MKIALIRFHKQQILKNSSMISANTGGRLHQKPIKDKGDTRKELQSNCC